MRPRVGAILKRDSFGKFGLRYNLRGAQVQRGAYQTSAALGLRQRCARIYEAWTHRQMGPLRFLEPTYLISDTGKKVPL